MAKKTSAAGKIAAGLGVAALAAGAAAVYYLTGPKGKQHQRQAKAWAGKARIEMAGRLKKMKAVSKLAYDQAAKEVLAKYRQAKKIQPEELAAFGKELMGHWDKISKSAAALSGKKPSASKKARR